MLSALRRIATMAAKELIQMRRDRVTFAMLIGIPLIQLTLFGYAINTSPKLLPTVVVVHEQTQTTRAILSNIHNTGYFKLFKKLVSVQQAEAMLQRGEAQFIIRFPANFEKKIQRNEYPAMLIEADATDPLATSSAITALANLPSLTLKHLSINKPNLNPTPMPFEVRVHHRYNPEGISQYNIVPGLMGVILTMTLVLVTAVAITRERERGTMEYLLITPIRPIEVMIGKIIPYVFMGYAQVILILVAAHFLFQVPMRGSITLVMVLILPFIAANLALGITFSTMAKNQLQAMQMSFFFFLPSILLSGFMFPFRGMPHWAQILGEVLPLTHFLRIIRGILLKDSGFMVVASELWPILIFLCLAFGIAILRYKSTLE